MDVVMRASSKMENEMVRAHSSTTHKNMLKGFGAMINLPAMAILNPIIWFMMAILKKDIKMERVRVFFVMEIDLMVGGIMMRFKVKVHMFS